LLESQFAEKEKLFLLRSRSKKNHRGQARTENSSRLNRIAAAND
jgi:hypothetical protein